jgi:hypothetical protein
VTLNFPFFQPNGGFCARSNDNWGLSLIAVDNMLGKYAARLFDKRLRPRLSLLLVACAVFAAIGIAIVWSAQADKVLLLPSPAKGLPPGRGLLDHYGFQAAFLSGPLVLVTTLFALGLFFRIVRDIDELIVPGTSAAVLRGLIKPHIDSLLLRGRWRAMLWLLVIIGIAVSLAIFGQLEHPENYWGNDVFNAKSHVRSYYVANAYLILLWGFIYPFGIFYAVHLTLSSEIIISNLMHRQLIRLNFLHVDRCGGMACFGTLNAVIMLIYAWPACAVYALHATHRYTYVSLVVGAIAISAALILQSLYGIYWVARAIRAQRENVINGLNKRIKDSMDDNRHNFTAAVATMEYRDRVLAVSSYPYAGAMLALVNVLRTAPAAIAFMKAFI